MKPDLKLDLYLVTDRKLSKGRSVETVVAAAVKGGATIVQLREKDCPIRDFIDIALKTKSILKPFRIPLIINDRVDVALAVDADGAHLGQTDMPYHIARKILGPDKIIGLSVESVEDAREAELLDVDYIGVSPVFFTPTKTDLKRELSLEGLREISAVSHHPIVGIGGINASNAVDVIRNGAQGIAVVSAICSADDPASAARELAGIVKNEKGRLNETV